MYYIWRISHLCPTFLAENLQHLALACFSCGWGLLVGLLFIDGLAWGLSFFTEGSAHLPGQEAVCADGSSRHGPGGCGCTITIGRFGGSSPLASRQGWHPGSYAKGAWWGWGDSPAEESPESRAQPGGVGLLSRSGPWVVLRSRNQVWWSNLHFEHITVVTFW